MAVIPARGGSTRLKDKNVHPIAGKPLIAHTLEAVLATQAFDKVVVSTDGEAIAEVARQYPRVEIHRRPEDFAGEKVTVVAALLDLMRRSEPHDVFAYFLPTCPFRTAEDIASGLARLAPDVDSVISVSRYQEPVQLAMLKQGDYVIPVFDNLRAGITNSKYLTPFYKPNGGFFIGWWDRILANGNFFTGSVQGVEIPKERAVDVDDALDAAMADWVGRNLLGLAPPSP